MPSEPPTPILNAPREGDPGADGAALVVPDTVPDVNVGMEVFGGPAPKLKLSAGEAIGVVGAANPKVGALGVVCADTAGDATEMSV